MTKFIRGLNLSITLLTAAVLPAPLSNLSSLAGPWLLFCYLVEIVSVGVIQKGSKLGALNLPALLLWLCAGGVQSRKRWWCWLSTHNGSFSEQML